MKALSIRQPWAFAILHSGKTVENRSWPTKYRGPLAIHAGVAVDTNINDEWIDYILRSAMQRGMPHERLPRAADLPRGGIVGVVDVVDCISESSSLWFFGPYGFVLANPRPVEFVPMKGRLGLFDIDDSLIKVIA